MIQVNPRYIWVSVLALATVVAVALALSTTAPAALGVIAYVVLSLLPGAAVYLALAREPRRLELALSALAISPVITTAICTVMMLLHVPVMTIGVCLLIATGILGSAVVLFRCQRVVSELRRSEAAVLLGTILLICVVVGYLPMSNEWWRTRADAVFHTAVIAQIRDFGLPPEDPYFIGFPLQYMWFYHVHVILMSEVSHFSPYIVMALLNTQALWALALGAFLLSYVVRKGFRYGYGSCLTALLGVNALFWVFLPLKALKAFTGDVRGMPELARQYTLHPYNMFTVGKFLSFDFNMEFLLDKFTVATATTVGLGLMAAAWYGCTTYVKSGRRSALLLAFFSSVGMMAFHTAIGVLAYGALVGAVVLLLLLRTRLESFGRQRILILGATLVVAFIVTWPYLHSITQAKRSEQLLPFSLSLWKMGGIFISCAMGVFLSAFQVRRLLQMRDSATWYLVLGTIAIALICTIIRLPGGNTANKLPLLVFFPLAVIGGWTFADWAARVNSIGKQRIVFAGTLVLAFAPLNVLALGAYYHTQPDPFRSNPFAAMNATERAIAKWVRHNTPRDSLFIDSDERVFLVASGPRRYYIGAPIYAEGWGYDEAEIAKREAVVSNLYSGDPLNTETLSVLGSLPAEVFVIVREDEPYIPRDKFESQPSLFTRVFKEDGISVFKVDREVARTEAASG